MVILNCFASSNFQATQQIKLNTSLEKLYFKNVLNNIRHNILANIHEYKIQYFLE
jgi:hypothetical protein